VGKKRYMSDFASMANTLLKLKAVVELSIVVLQLHGIQHTSGFLQFNFFTQNTVYLQRWHSFIFQGRKPSIYHPSRVQAILPLEAHGVFQQARLGRDSGKRRLWRLRIRQKRDEREGVGLANEIQYSCQYCYLAAFSA
jgi:hypothetical protein